MTSWGAPKWDTWSGVAAGLEMTAAGTLGLSGRNYGGEVTPSAALQPENIRQPPPFEL